MHPLIDQHRDGLIRLCRTYHVQSLEVFGSAATGAFRPGESDVDLLATFDTAATPSPLKQYVGFIEAAQLLLGCKVDVINPNDLRNPYFKDAVNQSRQPLYAA